MSNFDKESHIDFDMSQGIKMGKLLNEHYSSLNKNKLNADEKYSHHLDIIHSMLKAFMQQTKMTRKQAINKFSEDLNLLFDAHELN